MKRSVLLFIPDAAGGGIVAPSTASVVGEVIGDVAMAAASAFIPVGTLQDIVKLAAKYGPEAVTGILALFKKDDVTIADVEAAFAQLKPYDAYGIPDKVPTNVS